MKGCQEMTSFAALPQKITGSDDDATLLGDDSAPPPPARGRAPLVGSVLSGAMEKMGPPGAAIFWTST